MRLTRPAGSRLSPIYAFVSSSSSTSIQISNPQLLVGLVAPGLTTSVGGNNPNFFECENSVQVPVGSVNFTENFATAFKVQTNGVQDVPGAISTQRVVWRLQLRAARQV